MPRRLTKSDGYRDMMGNVDSSDVLYGKLTPKGLANEAVAEFVMESGGFADALETAMRATPDDPADIADQVSTYIHGMWKAVEESAKKALEREKKRQAEDEDY